MSNRDKIDILFTCLDEEVVKELEMAADFGINAFLTCVDNYVKQKVSSTLLLQPTANPDMDEIIRNAA